ncbi:hypothetical protein V2I01_10535 [Micromonospora sp. BRA006-A]|nr:hypothetical protein [Micromonospora sp. BRA006-A]
MSRERLGVRYLRAPGRSPTRWWRPRPSPSPRGLPRASLAAAIEGVAEVDNAVGDELRTHERWAGLRAKLEALPDRGIGDPEAAYRAYGEASDLLLALYRKVRESSGLIRDPRSDSFFLQDGIGGDLPTATVLAGRLVDLARLSAKRPAAERARVGAELAELRVSALGPATDLVTDLRSAVDSSESTDLGANVLTPLDTYQRSLETFAVYSAPGAGRSAPSTDQLTSAGISAERRQAAPYGHPRPARRAAAGTARHPGAGPAAGPDRRRGGGAADRRHRRAARGRAEPGPPAGHPVPPGTGRGRPGDPPRPAARRARGRPPAGRRGTRWRRRPVEAVRCCSVGYASGASSPCW